ncbi:MAG: hypothetical protein IJL76_02085 [Bacilli bacterium]|nr:hypothetical protein [Bacilli bacterium]
MKSKRKAIKNNIPLLVFGIILAILVLLIVIMYTNDDRTDKIGNMSIHYPRMTNVNATTRYINSNNNKLIEFSYSNYAWSYVYYGEMIMDSGDIYLFNCGEKNSYDSKECLTRKVESIDDKDLDKLLKYRETIQEKYSTKNEMNDYGEISISMIKDDIEIILIGKGDNKITNKSKDIDKVLKILKKYKIYV